MPLLHTLPVITRTDAGVVRLAADRGRIEQHLSSHQRHAAGAFREPLIPTNTHANFRVAGLPDLEAGVARIEIVLFMVARAIRNMALAVDTQVTAVGINNGDAVIARTPRQLKEADW